MDLKTIASKIEYSALDPFLKAEDLKTVCERAKVLGLNAVCVLPTHVDYVRSLLAFSDCKVICAVGYPFGSNTTKIKIAEAQQAAKDGADEIELVLNHSALFDGDEYFIANEIYALIKQTRLPLRLMLEGSVLDAAMLDKCSKLAWDNGADMLVLNTGIYDNITNDKISLLRQSSKKSMKLKAFGGIVAASQCEELWQSGADIIACENPFEIMKEFHQRGNA